MDCPLLLAAGAVLPVRCPLVQDVSHTWECKFGCRCCCCCFVLLMLVVVLLLLQSKLGDVLLKIYFCLCMLLLMPVGINVPLHCCCCYRISVCTCHDCPPISQMSVVSALGKQPEQAHAFHYVLCQPYMARSKEGSRCSHQCHPPLTTLPHSTCKCGYDPQVHHCCLRLSEARAPGDWGTEDTRDRVLLFFISLSKAGPTLKSWS